MRPVAVLAASLAAVLPLVAADRIAIQVGANKTANPTQIFTPQEVHAKAGDVVVFNFTSGAYDVLQSQFEQPCIPASTFNSAVNGFNSGQRPTVNGTVITTLEVPITDNFTAIWFYENSTCFLGGVGVINANDSSTQTLAGFIRNAERLNGTATSSSARPSSTAPGGDSGSGSGSGSGNSTGNNNNSSSGNGAPASRTVVLGALVAVPLAVLGLLL